MRLKLAEYDFDVVYKAGKMNVNADALSRNPIDDKKEESKHLQMDKNYFDLWLLMKKWLPRNKHEYSKNEVKPLKRRNLNPVIVPDDVDHFSEISEAQMLIINSKIRDFFHDFLSEESFTEIGKYILEYTNLFKIQASRLIFMTIFLLSPVFSKKYENTYIMENYNYKGSKEKTTRKSQKFKSKSRRIEWQFLF